MSYIKNKNSKDYTDITKSIYNILASEFGYTARISDIWKLLAIACGIKEFELLDFRLYLNGPFESYLVDQLIDWQRGEDIDFTDIKDSILRVGDFTSSEKTILNEGDIEERLWAIFLCICDPTLNL